jgi:hypothetical protein
MASWSNAKMVVTTRSLNLKTTITNPDRVEALVRSRSEDETLWGPAVVDHAVLVAMAQVRSAGAPPLPAAPLPVVEP